MLVINWVLVSEPGLFKVLAHVPGNIFFTRNEAREQHSLLDTIFDYILYFGSPGKHLYLSLQTYYMSAGFAGRHVVGVGDLSTDVFLEVQSKRYSQMLYLIDYVVPGLHFW